MTWVRLDDHFDEHDKITTVGALGAILQVRAFCFCARNLTDGRVPKAKAMQLAADLELHGAKPKALIKRMVELNLWEERDGDYWVHDFLDYNKSREEVLAERDAAAKRKGRSRRKSRPASRPESRPESRRDSQRDGPPTTRRDAARENARGSPPPVPVPLEDSTRGGGSNAEDVRAPEPPPPPPSHSEPSPGSQAFWQAEWPQLTGRSPPVFVLSELGTLEREHGRDLVVEEARAEAGRAGKVTLHHLRDRLADRARGEPWQGSPARGSTSKTAPGEDEDPFAGLTPADAGGAP